MSEVRRGCQKGHFLLIRWGIEQGDTFELGIEGEHEYRGTSYDKLPKMPAKLAIWAAYMSSRVMPKQTIAGLDTFTSGNKTPMQLSMTTSIYPIAEQWASDYAAHGQEVA